MPTIFKPVLNLFSIILLVTVCSYSQSTLKTIKRLPDTGQYKSYTNTFGEDHDFTINSPFFILNEKGIIWDTMTYLMWQQSDGGEMTIENALKYADTLTLGGYTDWRLPSAIEAYSVLNHQNSNPALDITYFTKNDAAYWWTGDVQKNDPNKIWVTNAGGGIGNHPKTETISAGGNKKFHVRAVRNMMAPETILQRFEKKENEMVFDNLTNLFWIALPNNVPVSWEGALTYADSTAISGYNDWRVPNIKELQSLQDVRLVQPCIDASFFPDIGLRKYWSSTSLPNQTSKAWFMDTHYGITSHDEKSTPNYLMLVRGGTDVTSSAENISKELTDSKIIAFPNPVNEHLMLKSNIHWQVAEIFDLTGRLVKVARVFDFQIDVSGLDSGLYILHVYNRDKTGKVTFVKR